MYRLDNISDILGTNVWIKRDDMNGIALGGNKVRKLQYLLADAKNKGYTCYTGKAFAGLIKRAREGFFKPEDKILFIHTGGAGGLFSQDWEHISLYKT